MPATPIEPAIDTSNVTFIEFADPESRSKFQKGPWSNEPDYCAWELFNFRCVMIRDMDLGIWRGCVGVPKDHPFHGKTLKHIIDEELYVHLPKVHGGICFTGSLSPEYKELNKRYWFIGFETMQGNDLIPVLDQADLPPHKPGTIVMANTQKYRTFSYVKKEVNSLAKALQKVSK